MRAGYMDIGLATSATSTEFTTLAIVTDPYLHAQDHQQNYTAIVVSRSNSGISVTPILRSRNHS